VGLALAGGGPLGAVYEVGALCALAEALPGLDLTELDGYVGVSAGGFIAAEEVAEAALYLLSRESRSVTGVTITVDGGWSIIDAT